MSGPPVTLIRAPVAPAMSTWRSGELIASSTASSARFSLSDSPIPMRATPPPFMIVRRSLKSRLTSPGRVMISVIPRIARASTESATLNAVWMGSRGTSSRSRSFGIVITVSTTSRRRSRPHPAFSWRTRPSEANGSVQTAIVSGAAPPESFAHCATTGAEPVPVPPPRPSVMKTMSEFASAFLSSSSASFAACSPTWGRAPAPSPRVSRRPRRILRGAWIVRRCWASVLQATISAPASPSSVRRLMVLQPPPPQPTTLIVVLSEASIASSSASSFVCGGGAGVPFFPSPGRWARIS